MKFRIGTRGSRLAVVQATAALERIEAYLPAFLWELVEYSSPGDRDRATDLRRSDPDFFTRDLDDAVLSGAVQAAIHSAKDVPAVVRAGLEWCWLPWREDPRDVLLFAAGITATDLPSSLRVGVSSDRRAAFCERRFPGAELLPVRGNIEERLQQLDSGRYDVLVMAAAALVRLGLEARIGEWIPLEELPSPEGQGVLCMTFRQGDPVMVAVRSLFLRTASFVGAGAGAGMCTLAGVEALEHADVCLHDALIDRELLQRLPAGARCISVGKRAAGHSVPQSETTQLLLDQVRRGYQVVRLKGGDPGVFGRLAEEVEALQAHQLPYHVVPGVSSLSMATTGTGLLLTTRGGARGFTVFTPRAQGGGSWDYTAAARSRLPLVLFMAGQVIDEVAATLLSEGWEAQTPLAFVCNAGFEDEEIVRLTLGEVTPAFCDAFRHRRTPSLCIIGDAAKGGYVQTGGVLSGRRVLLTCSDALQATAARRVRALGGTPVQRPLIRLEVDADAAGVVSTGGTYDWVVVTSPSSVRCLRALMRAEGVDIRTLPRLVACGPGTMRELAESGLEAALCPGDDYGAEGLLGAVGGAFSAGDRVLRLRSDRAGPGLADALRERCGVEVDDVVLYRNVIHEQDVPPSCDAVLFASRSAVESCLEQWGAHVLKGCDTVVLGEPTARALADAGITCSLVSPVATVDAALFALGAWYVNQIVERAES